MNCNAVDTGIIGPLLLLRITTNVTVSDSIGIPGPYRIPKIPFK